MGQCVFFQRVVDPVLVMVVHVFAHQPAEMSLTKHDDMVQALPPATPDPALRHTVLPGGLDADALRLQICGSQESKPFGVEVRVVV